MKSFRSAQVFLKQHPRIGRLALTASAGVFAAASLACVADPGLLLGPGNNLGEWMKNAVSGSGVEQALYRMMRLPGGEVLYRRSPRESRAELTTLLQSNPNKAALYSLRAMEDERALDFDAAERDWKSWAQQAEDQAGAYLDLANFYERRLKPQQELTALAVVGASPAPAAERLTPSANQRAWQAWQKSLAVVDNFNLPRTAAQQIYAGWEHRYPQERSVYDQELAENLAAKDYASAASLIDRYRRALPNDREFPVEALAQLEAARSGAASGSAVYERAFDPFWPAPLIDAYMGQLTDNHNGRKAADAIRARLEAHPEGNAEALKDAARLFYLQQKLGQMDAAKAALTAYRERKEARGAAWSASELYTLGCLFERAQDFNQAANYFYALAAQKTSDVDELHGLSGLARILLTAPEQPLRIGAGNIALYKNIATLDRGPGYWNGILSLWMNTQNPSGEYADRNQLASPYFHRAKAAEIITEIDRRFPQAIERPELHALLMDAYAAYGEDKALIHEGTSFLAQYPGNAHRIEVALQVADVYSRTNQTDKEVALYRDLLKELAAKADGVPLGTAEARSADYQRVLNRALDRLVQLQRLPDALALLRTEIDRNPDDPGLYEKLAQFFEQNRLNAHQEEVYQKAIAHFQQAGLVDGWYGKLARFYLRQRRNEDYRSLSRKVTDIFSGTELEHFLHDAPAPDEHLAYEVNAYAHQRFPHDLQFVHALIRYCNRHAQQAEAEKLLWQHWWEEPALRDQLFESLSKQGQLDAQLDLLRHQTPEIDSNEWDGLARTNPAAGRFWLEGALWQSHFEDGVSIANALAAEYPADEEVGETAASLYRSLAYFHPEDTDKAVAIEARLLTADPGNLERMARIGDIYADRGRMTDAAPYWLRMAEARPGEADGYLQSATVFWDYFDFDSALAQLQKGRERLKQTDLYAFEAGAIRESQNDLPSAVREYTAGALANADSSQSRTRLITLARRTTLQPLVEAQTADLLHAAEPSPAAISLRISMLEATHRNAAIAQELQQAIAHTDSFAVLDSLASEARSHGLHMVEAETLRRQISLTEELVRKIELRYQLVELLGQNNAAAADAEVNAIYRDHPRVLGVVRSTVDYDWDHNHRAEAVARLLEATQVAYPDLRDKFSLEAGSKLTELGEYARAEKLLNELLVRNPLNAAAENALANNYAHSGNNTALAAFYKERLSFIRSSQLDRGDKQMRIAQLRRGIITAATQLNQWDTVVDQYIELINNYPGDSDLIQQATLTAGAHNLGHKLTDFYQKTVSNAPRDARWAIVLGQIDTALEDFPAAIEAYSKAIRVRPEQKDLYSTRASLNERLRHLDEAAADYEKLYELSYHDASWKLKVAEDRARQARNADAVKALQAAWIDGKPPAAADYFNTASRLEEWNMLDEARSYAERGAELAGPTWLVDSATRQGAPVYALIMARLRHSDEAFTRLAVARMHAEQLALDANRLGAIPDATAGVSPDEWRSQLLTQNRTLAQQSFSGALSSMASAVATYYTPEEKLQFSNWLQIKCNSSSDGTEMRAVYLPAIKAGGFTMLEADLLWKFTNSSKPAHEELRAWLDLQRSRLQMDDAGSRIEQLATHVDNNERTSLLQESAGVYNELGDTANELRILASLDRMAGSQIGTGERYYDLLLRTRPQELLDHAGKDDVLQRMFTNAPSALIFSAIDVYARRRPPVWHFAYTGLAGLYLRVHQPSVNQAFEDALYPDLSIGERIGRSIDRDRQMAGDVWYYYGSRYGEYLDADKDPRAEGLLEAEIEHTPTRAEAYTELADYLAQNGRKEEALADYQRALSLHSTQPDAFNSMAIIYSSTGRKSEAVDTWKQAIHALAAQMDAAPVPESFWASFALVTQSATANGAWTSISGDADNLLHTYLKRNGSYRAEPLLEAGYLANGKSLSWLTSMSSIADAADMPGATLNSLSSSKWIDNAQQIELQTRIVEAARARVKPGEHSYELDFAEQSLVSLLIRRKQWDQARQELGHLSAEQLRQPQWIETAIRIADAAHTLTELLASWKQSPTINMESQSLLGVAPSLSTNGRRILLRFVYQTALDERRLNAANFTGLAEVALEEGKKDEALALLKRLTLTGSNMDTDTEAAASLLEKRGFYAEAIPFLQTIVNAQPWQESFRVRLAKAQLSVDAHNAAALQTLNLLANDSKAPYEDREDAATALRGRIPLKTASKELDLLAQSGCNSAAEANQAYFVQARMTAANCSSDARSKEALLRAALADAPGNTTLRLRYLQAAAAAQLHDRLLLAASPLLENGTFSLNVHNWRTPTYEESAPAQTIPPDMLQPQEKNKLFASLVAAYRHRGEDAEALQMIGRMIASEQDPKLVAALEKQRDEMQLNNARAKENAARAPIIHRDLEQDHPVLPRLLPGMAFTPRKSVEEEYE